MQKCPICYSDNLLTSEYCERCGAPLKTSPVAASSEIEYTIPSMRVPSPPPSLSTPPYTYLSTATPPSTYTYQQVPNAKARPSRTIGNTLFGVILYLIGASSTALGLFGSLQSSIGDSWAAACLIGVLVVSIIVLVIVLVRRRSTSWRWWQRLLGWIGTTIGMITLMVSGYILLDIPTKGNIPATTSDLFLGSCFIIYGLLVMFLSLR
jgi:hypothetical protein